MPIQLSIPPSRLQDLEVLRDLEAETIKAITDKLFNLDPSPIKPSDLSRSIVEVLPDQSDTTVTSIVRQLMSIYTIRRERYLTTKELLQGLLYGIINAKTSWNEKEIAKWKSIEPQLLELFGLSNVMAVAKALDLSYDYANIHQSAKIITDIRPVFNTDATEIDGAVISYTLRMYYDNLEGSTNISLALNGDDVERLYEECARALKEAHLAKKIMQEKCIKSVFIAGEEE